MSDRKDQSALNSSNTYNHRSWNSEYSISRGQSGNFDQVHSGVGAALLAFPRSTLWTLFVTWAGAFSMSNIWHRSILNNSSLTTIDHKNPLSWYPMISQDNCWLNDLSSQSQFGPLLHQCSHGTTFSFPNLFKLWMSKPNKGNELLSGIHSHFHTLVLPTVSIIVFSNRPWYVEVCVRSPPGAMNR